MHSARSEHNTQMLVRSTVAQPDVVRSTVAQPDVHNECAGMLLKNVFKVVRGVPCVCVLCVVLCRGAIWCVFGVIFEHCFKAVLKLF